MGLDGSGWDGNICDDDNNNDNKEEEEEEEKEEEEKEEEEKEEKCGSLGRKMRSVICRLTRPRFGGKM